MIWKKYTRNNSRSKSPAEDRPPRPEETQQEEEESPRRNTPTPGGGNDNSIDKPPRPRKKSSNNNPKKFLAATTAAIMKNKRGGSGSSDVLDDGDSTTTRSTTTAPGTARGSHRRPPLPETDPVQQHYSLQQQQQQVMASRTRASFLHRKTPSLSSYQTTPITKHYELNHQILSAFESHYNNKVYRIAYAMGMQFVETALLEIPKHGYFYSRRHERERMQSSLDAVRVTRILKQIVSEEDVVRDLADLQRVEKLAELAVAQVEQASEDQYEGQRAKAEAELRHTDHERHQEASISGMHNSSDFVLCEPILTAYDSISNILCPPAESTPTPAAAAAAAAAESTYVSTTRAATATSSHPQQPSSGGGGGGGGPVAGGAGSGDTLTAASVFPAAVPLDRTYSAPAWGPEGWESSSQELLLPTSQPPSLSSSTALRTSTGSLVPAPPQLMRNLQDEATDFGHNANSNNFFDAANASTSSLWMKDPDDLMLEKALYLSGLEVTPTVSMDFGDMSKSRAGDEFKFDDDNERVGPPPSYEEVVPSPPAPPKPAVSSSVLQLDILAGLYHEDFDQLRNQGQIRVSYANTYQGRLPDSTNGCTVIAPLLCIHHLFEDPNIIPDPSLPDAVIEQVIDKETPAILTELRTKLGLSAQAFLIPSDAHDYLIENGQLCQEQFINVVGGNILNETHLQTFVNALQDMEYCKANKNTKRRKISACWFFHEHVVAILKVVRDLKGTCWYDVIDGLPLKQTLAWVDKSDEHFSSSIGLTQSQEFLSEAFIPKTARIRCLNAEALTACLRWYACSKFTTDNISYIDQYPWDDKSCDFDPRVFQGFIWGSMS